MKPNSVVVVGVGASLPMAGSCFAKFCQSGYGYACSISSFPSSSDWSFWDRKQGPRWTSNFILVAPHFFFRPKTHQISAPYFTLVERKPSREVSESDKALHAKNYKCSSNQTKTLFATFSLRKLMRVSPYLYFLTCHSVIDSAVRMHKNVQSLPVKISAEKKSRKKFIKPWNDDWFLCISNDGWSPLESIKALLHLVVARSTTRTLSAFPSTLLVARFPRDRRGVALENVPIQTLRNPQTPIHGRLGELAYTGKSPQATYRSLVHRTADSFSFLTIVQIVKTRSKSEC
jgi:hypothetical protein